MRTLNAGLVAVLLLGPATGLAGDAKVETKVVKLPGLDDTVKQLKGKIVVMDFWADF
jgi:hypothetical protein